MKERIIKFVLETASGKEIATNTATFTTETDGEIQEELELWASQFYHAYWYED